MNLINKKYHPFFEKLKKYFSKIALPDYTLFSIYAVLIGLAVGLATVLFHFSIDLLNKVFFGKTDSGNYLLGAAIVIIIPAIGMLIQSIMVYSVPDISKRKGVTEVIKAVTSRGGLIPFRITILNFIASVINLGSGNTVGPEGPAAQIGGGVASKIGNLLHLSDQRRRTFTAAGSGAAIAAIFNAPLGGVFFAFEVILLNDFQTTTFSALILASVAGSAVSRIYIGNTSLFTFPTPDIGEYQYFYLYILLGVVCGLIGIVFLKYDEFTVSLLKKNKIKALPQWVIMILVGLLTGVSGYFFSDIFGIGYKGINDILNDQFIWQVVLILFLLKFILVPLNLNSGGFGGIFAPALFMGATIGFLFSYVVTTFTGIPANPTAYILVGMGATLAGINSIPITAILLVYEMTNEYSIILPLMLSVIISSTLVQVVYKGSYYLKILEKQGYRISEGRESSILSSITVESIMKNDPIIINQNAPLNEIVPLIIDSPHRIIFTVDDSGKLIGEISNNQIRPLITEYESLQKSIVAGDIADTRLFKVFKYNDLDSVVKLFTKADTEELPVVDDEDETKIIGVIAKQDVLDIYSKESIKLNLADALTKEIKTLRHLDVSKIADGYAIAERRPSFEFIGKTLGQLKLRNKYGVEILMIKKTKDLFDETKKNSEIIMPSYDYKITSNDILVLFGTEEKIKKSAEW